jgi:hypothetical protein
MNLVQLFMVVLIIGHLIACFWIKINYIQIEKYGAET